MHGDYVTIVGAVYHPNSTTYEHGGFYHSASSVFSGIGNGIKSVAYGIWKWIKSLFRG